MSPLSLLRILLLGLTFGSLNAAPPSLQLTLPPAWHGVPGVPISLYYDNVVLTEQPEQYQFQVTCNIGTAEAKRWTVTPEDKDVGDHAMEIVVKDAQGKPLQRAKTTLRIAPRTAGAGRELKLLIIGDSLTAATAYPNEIARLLSQPGNPKWTMVGTSKPASAKPGVAHEGYGGWKWSDFLTKFDPQPTGVAAGPVARKSTSPFLFAGPDGKPTLDLQRYLRENAEGQTPDVVTFLLGINDCFGANPDDLKAMDAKIAEVLDQADKLLTAFHHAMPETALAVGLTTPPNSREAGFEANYHGKYHRWGWKRIQHRLVQSTMERFGYGRKPGVFLVPTELNLDPVDGYPTNNGVHPNAVGYAQIGTSFYAWLKLWLATTKPI